MDRTYRIIYNNDGKYSHIEIALFTYEVNRDKVRLKSGTERSSVSWQTDNEAGEWYGLNYHCKGGIKNMAKMLALCKAFDKWQKEHDYRCQPTDFIEFLDEKGFFEVTYDNCNPITRKHHGLKVYHSILNGIRYGTIYAANEKQALKLAKWQHPKCDGVEKTDIVLNFKGECF